MKSVYLCTYLRLKNHRDEKDSGIGKNIELHAKKLKKVFFSENTPIICFSKCQIEHPVSE